MALGLPSEILDIIASTLDPRELQPLRLTCKTLANVCNKIYLRHVNIRSETGGVAKLGDISKHPLIAKHVRSITFSRVYPQCYDRLAKWLKEDRERLEQRLSKPESMLNAHDPQTCCDAFISFSNLESITILHGFQRHNGQSEDDWEENVLEEGAGVEQIEALLAGVVAGGIRLKILRAQYLDGQYFTRHTPDSIVKVWQSLRHLDLSLHVLRPKERDILKQILQQLNQLRHLRIEPVHSFWTESPSLDSIIDRRTIWPHLTSLILTDFNSTEDTIGDIMKSCVPELRSLSIGVFELTEGDWISILTKMRSDKFVPAIHGYLEDTKGQLYDTEQTPNEPYGAINRWLAESCTVSTPCPLTYDEPIRGLIDDDGNS